MYLIVFNFDDTINSSDVGCYLQCILLVNDTTSQARVSYIYKRSFQTLDMKLNCDAFYDFLKPACCLYVMLDFLKDVNIAISRQG